MEVFIMIFFAMIIGTMIFIAVIANKFKQQGFLQGIKNVAMSYSNEQAVQKSSQNNTPLLVFGIVFALVGLGVTYYFALDTSFVCNRANNLCSIQETNIFGVKKERIQMNIANLQSARADEASSGRNSRPYNVILQTSSGDVRLLGVYKLTSAEGNWIANQINTFINSQQDKIEINDSGKSTKFWGLFYAAIGFVLIFFATKKKRQDQY